MPYKMSRSLPHMGRSFVGKMRGVIAGHIGVILRQIGDDRLRMYAFKEIIRFSVRCYGQVKVTRTHTKWAQFFPHNGIRTKEGVCRKHCFGLRLVFLHNFQPTDIFFGPCIINDVRTIHHRSGVQRAVRVIRHGRDEQTSILPVIQICRCVITNAPVPDARSLVRFFLVFAVPVVHTIEINQ